MYACDFIVLTDPKFFLSSVTLRLKYKIQFFVTVVIDKYCPIRII